MKNPNVWPDLAPHLEGDEVPDHPVAHLVGQLACIWIAYQLLHHPGQNIGQFLVQNRSKGIRDIRSCPEQRSSNGNSPVQEIKVILKEKRGSSFLNCRWSSNDDTCLSSSTLWQVSCPWGHSQQGAASPEFSPWKGNAIMISWLLIMSRYYLFLSKFLTSSLSGESLTRPASWATPVPSVFLILIGRTWQIKSGGWPQYVLHHCLGLLNIFNPTLLRSDLGMKRIARITGGGGLFDLLSRAWEENKESDKESDKKVQEPTTGQVPEGRHWLLSGQNRGQAKHGELLKSCCATRIGGRSRGGACLRFKAVKYFSLLQCWSNI